MVGDTDEEYIYYVTCFILFFMYNLVEVKAFFFIFFFKYNG